MKATKLLIGLIIAASALTQAQLALAASDAFTDGMAQFNAKRYHAAALLFSQAEQKNPAGQKIHLYLGLTFEQLKEPAAARSEYEACFRINPFDNEGMKAKQALLNLSAAQAAREHAPLDEPETVRQTVGTIQRQTAQAKANYMFQGNVYANQRLMAADLAAQYYRDQANWSLAALRQNRVRDPYYAQEISNWSVIKTHYAYTDAQAQALRAGQWATRAARNLQDSANNLMSQIDQRAQLPDDAVLRAKGTNLYVRYYGSPEADDEAPPDPPEQLRAQAGSLKLPQPRERDELQKLRNPANGNKAL